MLKRFSMLVFVLIFALGVVAPVAAQGDGPNDVTTPSTQIGGVAVPHGQQRPPSETITYLSYHGGPVMHTNKTYAIYWRPTGYIYSSNYITVINRYFADVAAASGIAGDVYYSDTQYYANPGAVHITTSSVFGGYYIDTANFPANGCSPTYTTGLSKCLNDAQLRTEIKRVIALKGWVINGTSMFFMFTPQGVGSCWSATDCAFTQYCAYHSYTNTGVIYANQPYTYTKPNDCGIQYAYPGSVGTPPNGAAVDSTLNVTSHEHNEAITDPQLNAWWDSTTGDENGDKCAWTFGIITGNSYNQTINTHHYILQREWSNFSSRCVLVGK